MERLQTIKPSLLKDKFKKYGDTFELVAKNESNRMYCYRRTTPEGIVYFEVFRSNLGKDENGRSYEYYPRDSQFGATAWCIRDSEHAQKKIQKYMQMP
ncbi:hypothetical protein BUN20_21820 [Bacteroides fragilis]|uniref:hypothetical protein n=1 Tax=Bacteroides fragilis TaxID=817 RepID=UPI000C78563E|nr:hypothetical protein [Bacteroides fragilis]AUI48920.1 hypothetical protein BUN20_21820 [Bacteroides fragilis]